MQVTETQVTETKVPSIDAIYVAVIATLLVAAAISAVKFQQAQSSIERRSQIGMALTDTYVARARVIATDRERPEAAAKAEAAIEETASEHYDVEDAKPVRNRKVRRSTTKQYAGRDRLGTGGW